MTKRSLVAVILLTIFSGCAQQLERVTSSSVIQTQQKFLTPSVSSQQSYVPSVKPLPEGVSIHRLDNGLEVLLIENRALPMVGVNVQVKIGSAYETFATSGMSHMLEHLLFNGTETRTQKQLYDDVDRIGGYNNANTSNFYTNYMMVTPAEYIREGMEIQADMLFHSTIPADKFEKEKGIVLEEIARSLSNTNSQLENNLQSLLFNGHALSLPTLGTYSTIESMSRQDVVEFYQNAYVPNNMIMSAIGNFHTDSMLSLIQRIYGVAKPGNVARPNDQGLKTGLQPLNIKPSNSLTHHRFYNGSKTKLQLAYPLPDGLPPEFFELLEEALSGPIDSLETTLMAHFPRSVESLETDKRLSPIDNYLIVTTTLQQEDNLQKIADSVMKYLSGIRFSLSEETVNSVANRARTDFLKNLEKPHMFGIYYADELVINGIDRILQFYYGEGYLQATEQLDRFQLPDNPIILVQHPSTKSTKLEKTKAIQTKVFENEKTGLELIIRQNPASRLLAIHYLMKHKAFWESKYGKNAAKILHDCFGQRMNSEKNQKLSSHFGFTFTVNDNPFIPMDDIYLHPDFGYIRVEGLADDVASAIIYLNDQMTDFIPTRNEFEKAVRKFQSFAHPMGGQKAKEIFKETYESMIYEPDKYPEGPEELTYENLVAFAQDYFQPANMVMSVVSPEDAESIHQLFSSFTGNKRMITEAAYQKRYILPEEPISVEKEGGGEQAFLFWGFIKEINEQDKPALQALSLILSDRIIFDIREKQGLAYRMKAGVNINQDKALFYIRMGTRPQNVDTIIAQAPELLSLKTIESISPNDLEKSINMYLGRMMFRRLSSINQAYYLGHSRYFHGDINYDQEFLEKLKKVTLTDVNQVAEKYLKIENPVLVIVR